MKQISLKVSESKFDVFMDFLKTLDYVKIKKSKKEKPLKERVDFPEKLETGCATDFEEASIKNKNRLESAIKKYEAGKYVKRDLIEE